MSRYNYVITIKQSDYKNVNAISLLMLLIAVAVFLYTAKIQWTSRVYHNVAVLYLVFSGIITGWCIYCLAFTQKLKRVPYYRFALAAAAVGWFTEPLSNYWVGTLFALAALVERRVKFPVEISAGDEGVVFNTLPAKLYRWMEINNMLLKDNIITIDFKNNKIYQQETAADVSKTLEAAFNSYCSKKLSEVL